MHIKVNGKPLKTKQISLLGLQRELGYKKNKTVMILEGYQTDEDLPLYRGAAITFIKKGKLPPKEILEEMLCARHTPGVHAKVKKARVAIAGLGGLGSAIAINLARTGVGHLHLVDYDRVEPSNLNRQHYHITDLGRKKTKALKGAIAEINPFIKIETHCLRVTSKNAKALFEKDTIVCEAFDNPAEKAMLVNCLLGQNPRQFLVAASGMAGYESGNSIKTKKVMKNLYLCGDGETGAQIGRGLMAPRVSICAGHQANMVLRLILDEEKE